MLEKSLALRDPDDLEADGVKQSLYFVERDDRPSYGT